ncbi:MAG: MFS transporter [Armatimonadota bacterium]|nr:MFS transporter [Armatimonadota bacterium]MDR7452779.1 MFS transporter [Armatimonadota bacterium]MDR7468334.1 MFS transporter [Armatimonadota bacterium]MDR7495273.1 MFS transporter [Armatimonadota bacterium]MDR7500515.1 MFS transporter [Armatimonadota bacterium]
MATVVREVGGSPESRRAAVRFVVLLGVVSLLADMTYEGARSVVGPYLGLLGASAAAVGVAAGAGELLGYALRLGAGYLADRTRRYWTITFAGYLINLGAVPLLALAGSWPAAAALVVLERIGKGVRTPARDAMLSHAAHRTGRGWGFGLHEALDQVGAVLGPLAVAGVLVSRASYRAGFAVLSIPAALALAALAAARRNHPNPRDLEPTATSLEAAVLPRAFWIYLAGAALVGAGYADFSLLAFHWGRRAVVPPATIPLLYALAMGVDALAALGFGRIFDRLGIRILAAGVGLSLFFAPLAFLGGAKGALLGVTLWGIGMGAQESIMRAAVAGMVGPDRRGSAYGIFNAGYGLCWFLGSAAMGVLYAVSIPLLVAFSVAAQAVAIPLIVWSHRQIRPASAP